MPKHRIHLPVEEPENLLFYAERTRTEVDNIEAFLFQCQAFCIWAMEDELSWTTN